MFLSRTVVPVFDGECMPDSSINIGGGEAKKGTFLCVM